MSIWGALAGGFVGTLVLTTALRTANELGLTRVDLPFLLGTAVTGDRARAKALGYLLHLVAGEVFALVYYAIFAAHRHERLAARGAVRAPARDRLRHRARQRPAPGRPSPHGQHAQRRRQQPAARASRLPDAQLRPRDRDLLAHVAYGAIVGLRPAGGYQAISVGQGFELSCPIRPVGHEDPRSQTSQFRPVMVSAGSGRR